jgi:prevent-host-death family protein
MIKTLKGSKATLSALVELASQGEEVVITVRGVPKARLCPLAEPLPTGSEGRREWGQRSREIPATYSVGTHESSCRMLDELREDRM